jgi:hypothetical protein
MAGSGRGLSFLCALVVGVAALTPLGPVTAQSRVGVTSATDGDPLGKPPTGAERVLRIGIDVQANEVVTTNVNDRAHLVFLDGSSLTVGPNARLTIDKFVYDPNSKTGELALTATQGVFRLVGGKISKTNPVTINTPSSTIGIRGGIVIFNVNNSRTVANFIFGNNMTVTGQGQVQNATRPGSVVIANAGSPPSPPSLLPPGGAAALINPFDASSSSGSSTTSSNTTSKVEAGTKELGSSAGQSQPTTAVSTTIASTLTGTQTVGDQAIQNTGGASNPQNGNATLVNSTFTPPTTVTSQTQSGFTNGLIVGPSGTRVPAIDANTPSDFSIATQSTTTGSSTTGTTAVRIIIRGLDGTLSSPTATLNLGPGNSNFVNDSVYGIDGVPRPGTVQTAGGSTTLQNTTELASRVAAGSRVDPSIPQGTGGIGSGQCTCDFLKFGYWSSTIDYTGTYRTGQQDIITNAPFVAGTVGSAPQLPNTQKITYDGFMYGRVQHGANSYMASGPWSLNWDMSKSAGKITVPNFDGMALSGTAALTPGTANITGSMQSTSGGNVSGPLAGAFFASPSNPSNYVAGAYGLAGSKAGTSYASGGIFAAQPKPPSP